MNYDFLDTGSINTIYFDRILGISHGTPMNYTFVFEETIVIKIIFHLTHLNLGYSKKSCKFGEI